MRCFRRRSWSDRSSTRPTLHYFFVLSIAGSIALTDKWHQTSNQRVQIERRIVAISSEIHNEGTYHLGSSRLFQAAAMIAPPPDDAMPSRQLAYSCTPSPAGNTKTESTHSHNSALLRPLEERTGSLTCASHRPSQTRSHACRVARIPDSSRIPPALTRNGRPSTPANPPPAGRARETSTITSTGSGGRRRIGLSGNCSSQLSSPGPVTARPSDFPGPPAAQASRRRRSGRRV